jgi:glycosyltransferase involved in cell wall biosynthesis
MKISIVIPVYNEEDQLGICLEAISQLNPLPYEVIVVDNNSTDNTVALALKYPFVKVLHEPKQGVVHARTRGFDEAKGEIIARIDADSILPRDWLLKISEVFGDSSVDATSGEAHYYGVAAAGFIDAIDLYIRARLGRKLKNKVFLWGSNMAIRKQAWQSVKPYLCEKGDMHEDYDVAIHLQEIGRKVTFDKRMKAGVSSRRIDVGYISFMKYVWKSPSTYAQHGLRVKRHLYPVVAIVAVGYVPGYILHRGYNFETGKFSFKTLFEPRTVIARVDPTANVA